LCSSIENTFYREHIPLVSSHVNVRDWNLSVANVSVQVHSMCEIKTLPKP
jgi:hypothetical protein